MSVTQGQEFLSALFTSVSPASTTGTSTEGLIREGEMGPAFKGFAYQAEELNCILRILGNLWKGEKNVSQCQVEGGL